MNKIIVAYKLLSSSILVISTKPNIQFRISPDMLHGRYKLKRLITMSARVNYIIIISKLGDLNFYLSLQSSFSLDHSSSTPHIICCIHDPSLHFHVTILIIKANETHYFSNLFW